MSPRLLFIVGFSIGLMNCSLAQVDPNAKLKKDLQRYKDMKDGGMAMIVVGSMMLVTGGILEASQWNKYGLFEEHDHSYTGTVMVIAGGALLGGGIPLTISGRNKYRELRNSHPEIISLGIKASPTITGVGVTFKF